MTSQHVCQLQPLLVPGKEGGQLDYLGALLLGGAEYGDGTEQSQRSQRPDELR